MNKAGRVPAEAFVGLNSRQQHLLIGVSRAQQARAISEEKLETDTAALVSRVADAVSGGVPVKVLAGQLGVSPSRVYQMTRIAHDRARTVA